MSMPLSFFIAGIMQGSIRGTTMHDQEYRARVAALVKAHYPEAECFDPLGAHPGSLAYDHETGRDAFFELMEKAGRTDVLIAFVPEASMGTAIELWSAFHAGAVIVTVSPLTENWVVKFLSDHIVPDLPALEACFANGTFARLIAEKIEYR